MDPALAAAAIGVGGTAIVGLAGFWANVRNTNKNAALTLRAVELTEQGQVTDRYSKAIEQLGSDKLEVRIGGIYALERVAHDSPPDHPTVMEVLAALVREHSHEQRRSPSSAEPGGDPREHLPRPDLQAAVTVIGRNPGHEGRRVNLAGTYLAGMDFAEAVLAHTDLTDTDLTRADLAGAYLTGTTLYRATLTDAYLVGTCLSDAKLTDAKLTGATLTGADLTRADLTRADLTRANLTGADLTGATLTHADFTGANLTGATLTGAFLPGADLTSVNLAHAKLTGVQLVGADLTGANITDATITGAELTNADLTGATIIGTKLTGTKLTGTDLTGAVWPLDAVVPAPWQRDTGSGRLTRADTKLGGATTDAAPGT